MQIHEWIRTIGSIGTMLSAVVAVVTYVNTTRRNRRAVQSEKAARLRERLMRIASEVQRLKLMMKDGAAMIAAAASVASEIESRLSPVASKEEIDRVLRDDGVMLSVSVTGWYKSPAAVEISDRVNGLELEASQLTGGLQVLGEELRLLAAVAHDGYSPMIFRTILTATKEVESLQRDLATAESPKRTMDRIAVALHGNAAMYYVTRYEKAVEQMSRFVEILVNALVSLDDARLAGIPGMQIGRDVEGATRTATVAQGLRELGNVLSVRESNALSVLNDNIATYLSKEHAQDELKGRRRTA